VENYDEGQAREEGFECSLDVLSLSVSPLFSPAP
jgi:hypothetical protein